MGLKDTFLAWPVLRQLTGDDPLEWAAAFADTGEPAVVADAAFVRPSDPLAIAANPARIRRDLGWQPRPGVERFLQEMLDAAFERTRAPAPTASDSAA